MTGETPKVRSDKRKQSLCQREERGERDKREKKRERERKGEKGEMERE